MAELLANRGVDMDAYTEDPRADVPFSCPPDFEVGALINGRIAINVYTFEVIGGGALAVGLDPVSP